MSPRLPASIACKALRPGMRTIALVCCILLFTMAGAQETPRIGATAMPGLLAPAQSNEHVSLDKVMVEFKGFREKTSDQDRKIPMARFRVQYAFKNNSNSLQTVPAVVPVEMVFTEFGRENRSLVLDNLAALVPGLFDISGDGQKIREEMAALFEQRNFIRRFMNVRDLGRLNMDYAIVHDEKKLDYQKAELEFEWVKDQQNSTGYLRMELNQQIELTFDPNATAEYTFEFLVPAFTVGRYDAQYYVPLSTADAGKWAGDIGKAHFLTTINEGTQAFPYYFEHEQQMMNEDKLVTTVTGHQPERNERIGFYATKNPGCGCYKGDGPASKLFIPRPVRNVSASSWYQNQYSERGTCFTGLDEDAFFSNLPLVVKGLDGTLGFTGNALEINNHTSDMLNPLATRDCDNDGEPFVTFTKGYHPVWAFDDAGDSITINGKRQVNTFPMETAWCAAGGRGEYLEFEITQPVKKIKFYTGVKDDRDKYKRFGRVKMMVIEQVDGSFKKLIVLSDIITSSYIVQMPAGQYRMTIKETYPGIRFDATCLSKVQFTFDVNDPWLESVLEKPKK